MTFVLRPYQTEAINSVFSYYENGGAGHPILALPTGTGKSLIQGELIRQIFHWYPGQRVLGLTHVQELIEQNAQTILNVWPLAPLGINSAGLKRRDVIQPIIYGGVQSVVNQIDKMGFRDLLFIDECHLLSPNQDSRYQKVISALKRINPNLKVVGLTATMYRLGQGYLTDGTDENPSIFTDCIFNYCTGEKFRSLIAQEWLSYVDSKATDTKLDVSNAKTSGGEFVQADIAATPAVLRKALQEMCQRGENRRSWLVFNAGIENADQSAEQLRAYGISAASVHSELKPDERKRRIDAFKRGEIRAITNNNVLTTGFDHPPIDLIGMLRATLSPGLWVQMVGRGTRVCEGKDDCLCLDFAGNSQRLGTIDEPRIPKPKEKGGGDAPVKICDNCGAYNHARVVFCTSCGVEFSFKQKIAAIPSNNAIISGGPVELEWYDVTRIMYNRHVSKAQNVNIAVNYFCGLKAKFTEYVCFDNHGMSLHKAHEWWRQRFTYSPPPTTDDALTVIKSARIPRRIKVWTNAKPFPKVIGVEF